MEREPPVIGPFGTLTLVMSVAFLAAGVAEPAAARALLRLFLVCLGLGFVFTRAHAAESAASMTQDFYSPFDGAHPRRSPPSFPSAVRAFARELGAADRPRRAGRTPIPGAVCRHIVGEATRRLALHHGLQVEQPDDHSRIRGMVSEPTWKLIAPGDAAASPLEGPRVDRLPMILADLERL